MMQSAPLILAGSGLLFLGFEVWATRVNQRDLRARSRRERIAYWTCMSAIGIALVYISLFAKYDLRPNLRVFGVPFLSVVWEFDGKNWIDFTGPLTLPAFFGNGAVAFLLPQLIVAGAMRIVKRR